MTDICDRCIQSANAMLCRDQNARVFVIICVEVCVNKADAAALRVYEKAGFTDTGYLDEDTSDSLNLMYYFK